MNESNIHSKRIRVKRWRRKRAHMRVRNRMRGTSERPRLTVFKSLKHLYAQLIDDERGHTLAAASTMDSEVRGKLEGSTAGKAAARAVGETVAERAKAAGIDKVVFDRSGYIYHGKVKEIAEGARSKGLDF